jgi:hypothetical protein
MAWQYLRSNIMGVEVNHWEAWKVLVRGIKEASCMICWQKKFWRGEALQIMRTYVMPMMHFTLLCRLLLKTEL